MPSNYFNRIAGTATGALMRPARPISSLWKSARLESKQQASPSDLPVTFSPSKSSAARKRPEKRPPQPEARGFHSSVEVERVTVPHPPSLGSQVRKVGQASHSAIVRDSLPSLTPSSPMGGREAVVTPTDSSIERRERPAKEPEPIRELSPSTEVVTTWEMRHRSKEQTSTKTRDVSERIAQPSTNPEDLTHASLRGHSTQIGFAHGRSETRVEASAPQGYVHIGTIEVQIVAPPVVQRAPHQPKARLARGYAFWSNWQGV
jgi:hypothetical protein